MSTGWTSIGPSPILNGQAPGNGNVTGRVTGIAADPFLPDRVFISAAGGGVWQTTNATTTSSWTQLTDTQSTVSMGAISMAHSDTQTLYAGTGEANFSLDSNYGRGILKSANGGASWTLQTGSDSTHTEFDRQAVSKIAISTTLASTAYAAVAHAVNSPVDSSNLPINGGIWMTTTGGMSWANKTLNIQSYLGLKEAKIPRF